MRFSSVVVIYVILLFTAGSCSYMRNTPSYRAEEGQDKNQLIGKTPSPSRKAPSLMDVSHINSIEPEITFYESLSLRFGYQLNGSENPMLLNEIARWLGTPYRFGGENQNGIDCSAFALIVYREVYGVDLERMTVNMAQRAQRINRQHLREGDLIFFRINQQRISHVGIYISNNKFAHASTRMGVIISDMDEEYYRKRFAFAGRIIH
jgi:murein DD-endopeptidase / murein LD-carboxypeptidase